MCSKLNQIRKETSSQSSNQSKHKNMEITTVGLYYDDPESVPENELRFAVGAVLSTGNAILN